MPFDKAHVGGSSYAMIMTLSRLRGDRDGYLRGVQPGLLTSIDSSGQGHLSSLERKGKRGMSRLHYHMPASFSPSPSPSPFFFFVNLCPSINVRSRSSSGIVHIALGGTSYLQSLLSIIASAAITG